MVRVARYRLGSWGLLSPGAWVATAIAAGWTLALWDSITGRIRISFFWFALAPLVPIAGFALARRRPRHLGVMTGWAAIVSGAVLSLTYIVPSTRTTIAVPVVVLAAALARRFPSTFLAITLVAAGFYGTAQAFFSVSLAPVVDVTLAGLWLGTIWSYLFDARSRTVSPFTGMILMALYAALTFFEIFTSNAGTTAALQDFRGATWYMMAFLLLAVAPLSRETIRRMALALVSVAVLVGGYATYRWLTGQSTQELANAASQMNNVVDGRIRLFGSFVTGKELAFWTSAVIPFCLAYALAFPGWRRLLALAACALCAIAMFGADVRVAVVALVPAVAVVFLLYQLARGFPGAHLGTTLAVLFGAALIAVGGFAITLSGHSDTSQRYSVLLSSPTQDPSYQARVFKWHDALVDIGKHPFGQGLASSGRTQQRYGQYLNISTNDVDNSYLKIALEQGAAVTLFYVVALVLLTWGLARRSILIPDRDDAAFAIGAVGTLVVMAIFFFVGTYVEGLPVLTAWLCVGLGVAGVTRRVLRGPTGQSAAGAGDTG